MSSFKARTPGDMSDMRGHSAMQIFVRSGKTTTLTVHPDVTIADLMHMIEAKLVSPLSVVQPPTRPALPPSTPHACRSSPAVLARGSRSKGCGRSYAPPKRGIA